MKQINIVCYPRGTASVTSTDVHIENESLSSKIVVDFSAVTGETDTNKWIDLVHLKSGTSLRYDLGVGDIVELELDYEVTVAGIWTLTPFIYNGLLNKFKFKTNANMEIYKQIEAGTPEAVERDDFIFQLSERVKALEEGTDMDVRIVESIAIDTNVQDQISPLVMAKLSRLLSETTLANLAVLDTNTIVVSSATNFAVGRYVSIFNTAANRFYLGTIVAVLGTTITLDMPLDFAYPAGSNVTVGDTNMNVDGSVTPVKFKLRNTNERIAVEMDIVRMMFAGLTDGECDWSEFGNIPALEKGCVCRKTDGIIQNIFVVKSNNEFANLMYDFDLTSIAKTGQDGFKGRLTFGGQSKIGVVIRVAENDDIEFIIQDNLSGLQKFEIQVQGHLVVD